ncbi:MAG: hypothetical protein RRY20_07885 [Bilophila sp.]
MAEGAGRSLHFRAHQLLAGLTIALCEAVRAWVAHTMPGTDGTTRRDHIEQLCKQKGKTPEELGFATEETEDDLDVPDDGAYLWNWFQELSSGRGNNGFGPSPLGWADMAAWAQLTAIPLTPYETLTLRSMDTAYLTACADTQKKNTKGKK